MRRSAAITCFVGIALTVLAIGILSFRRALFGSFGITGQQIAILASGALFIYFALYIGLRLLDPESQPRASAMRRVHWHLGWALIAVSILTAIGYLASPDAINPRDSEKIDAAVLHSMLHSSFWLSDSGPQVMSITLEDTEPPSPQLLASLQAQKPGMVFRSWPVHTAVETPATTAPAPDDYLFVARIRWPLWRVAAVRAGNNACVSEFMLIKVVDDWHVIGSDGLWCI
jgi:hypothetical protein